MHSNTPSNSVAKRHGWERGAVRSRAGRASNLFALLVFGGVGSTMMAVAGCSHWVDPFQDESQQLMSVSTPSVRAVLATDRLSPPRSRPFAPREYAAVSGSVEHGPLYFEDGFEDGGSDDGKLAWTEEDYLQWLYWDARFLVNLVGLPFSMIVHPPWTVMSSDGVPDREWLGWHHDAHVANKLEKTESIEPPAVSAVEAEEAPSGDGADVGTEAPQSD